MNQNNDTISRQAAIDALNEQIAICDKALSSFDISTKDEYAIKVERASLCAFRETLECLPSAQPERRTCEGCKHDNMKWHEGCKTCARIYPDHYEVKENAR